ncbi:hypothetical protein niasHT_037630 [Heterodera trifolii]|uniref:Uncharacterized protein n=1 Tax=Heterodera trifolii TaxID=157864 RepID=A0ABD2IGJ7_9BILA
MSRLPNAIEFANSMLIEYEMQLDVEEIRGKQRPLEMELELCQRVNPTLANYLLSIRYEFEFAVDAAEFFDTTKGYLKIRTEAKHLAKCDDEGNNAALHLFEAEAHQQKEVGEEATEMPQLSMS